MQIILKEKVRNLGALGELVNVKPGYARNYLIPHGKAMLATKSNMAAFEAERVELERLAAVRFAAAQEMATKLQEIVLVLKSKAGEGGKLFGSVGSRDIADAAHTQGLEIEKHQVRIPGLVIRELGEFEVGFHLHPDVDVQVKIRVEGE
jgi:large subunit ribosomal protein L9